MAEAEGSGFDGPGGVERAEERQVLRRQDGLVRPSCRQAEGAPEGAGALPGSSGERTRGEAGGRWQKVRERTSHVVPYHLSEDLGKRDAESGQERSLQDVAGGERQ
jgi:hypothetical protein